MNPLAGLEEIIKTKKAPLWSAEPFLKMQVVKKPYVFNLLRFIYYPSAYGTLQGQSAHDPLMYL